jgi:hypothetical protein
MGTVTRTEFAILSMYFQSKNVLNRCLGERHGGGLRHAHFNFSMYDLHIDGENGMWWKLVHRIDVMELAQQNLKADDIRYNRGGGGGS